MNTKPITSLLGACVLLTLGSIMSAIAPLDATFTYQGTFDNNGTSITGIADFKFRLYDSITVGSQIGPEVSVPSVVLDQGLFKVDLNFGVDALNGDQRWLEIDARFPAGSGAYVTLAPRQSLAGTPYSIQTRGLFVDAANNVGIGTTTPQYPLDVRSSTPRTLVVENTVEGGVAVLGQAINAGVFGSGVAGTSEAVAGFGVVGEHQATTGFAVGVRGTSIAPDGRGVWGLCNGLTGRGVWGSASGVGKNFGVYGLTQSDIGTGVYGLCNRTSGVNYGIFGETASSTGYAGYFKGGMNYFQGNVGIGVLNPTHTLDIEHPLIGNGWGIRMNNKTLAFWSVGMRLSDSGFFEVTNKANLANPNYARLDSGGNWTVVSDIRMKKQVAPMHNVLDRAMELNPITFIYTNQDQEHNPDPYIGFSAQSVQPLFPSLVTKGDDLLTMNYSGLSVVAVAALQELKYEKDAEIKELNDRINNLEDMFQKLNSKDTSPAH